MGFGSEIVKETLKSIIVTIFTFFAVIIVLVVLLYFVANAFLPEPLMERLMEGIKK